MVDQEQDAAKEARAAYDVDDHKAEMVAGALPEQYIVDREGKRVGVILPFGEYEKMKEDLHDLAVVAERREETPISLEEMKQRLKEDGLL